MSLFYVFFLKFKQYLNKLCCFKQYLNRIKLLVFILSNPALVISHIFTLSREILTGMVQDMNRMEKIKPELNDTQTEQ
jgi:hypothetical protein